MATSLKMLLFILTSNFAWSFKRFRYIAARIILHLSVLIIIINIFPTGSTQLQEIMC
jgi:hypothetical protein